MFIFSYYHNSIESQQSTPSRTAAKASASATQRSAGLEFTAELEAFMPSTPLLPKHGAPFCAVMDGQACEMIDVRIDSSLKHSVQILCRTWMLIRHPLTLSLPFAHLWRNHKRQNLQTHITTPLHRRARWTASPGCQSLPARSAPGDRQYCQQHSD